MVSDTPAARGADSVTVPPKGDPMPLTLYWDADRVVRTAGVCAVSVKVTMMCVLFKIGKAKGNETVEPFPT